MKNGTYINHIAFVLDKSSSMTSHRSTVIKVADEQIKHLAKRSQELDQETRVTVYTFADQAECLIYDKDVLRLPSIASLYSPYGNTALIDATLLAVEDLKMQPEKYGDHSFLAYVLTDGQENRSSNYPSVLQNKLANLPDHWTVAALVPDSTGESWCRKVGFSPGNIAQWDTTSQAGLEDSFVRIRTATDNFMLGRQQGFRGTRSLFSMDPTVLNKTTVQSALVPLHPGQFYVFNVDRTAEIREWVESKGHTYHAGGYYYQLTKPEKVQANKRLAVMEKSTGKIFTGGNARDLVGLPDHEVRVRPDFNPEYKLFIQSNSFNRKLVPGTELLRIA